MFPPSGIQPSVGPTVPASGTPTPTPVPVYQTQHQVHAAENCRNGKVLFGVEVGSTVGAGVVIAVAWPEVTATAGIEAAVGESAMTFIHGAHALGHLLIAPLFAVGTGFNEMIDSCGTL